MTTLPNVEKDGDRQTLEVQTGTSKVIQIIDPPAPPGQDVKETIINHGTGGDKVDGEKVFHETFSRFEGYKRYHSLREAATTAAFPALLRDGLKGIMFDSYNGEPKTWDTLAFTESSNKPAEDYLEANLLGVLPMVGEGLAYPEVDGSIDRAVRVVNNKRGVIFGITEDLWRFDRLNIIRQYPKDLGTAAGVTQEQAVYSVLNTTGNYVRTTADNDIGNNTSALTFSAQGLITAYATLRTMKDRKSGRYLNIIPDTLVVTPQLEFAAKQLLLAPNLTIPGDGVTTAKVYGTGGGNPFRGLVQNIIVSPYLGTTYQWLLGVRGKGLVYQEVDPLQMLTLADPNQGQLSEGYFIYDKLRYRVRIWFGAGLMNDRYWFFSSSTTIPTVA